MNEQMTPQERAAALLNRIVGIIPMQPSQREVRIEWLIEYAQETRRAALLEAAQQVCMHCGKRAIGLQVGVTGPNVAGNYVHNPPEDSRVKESALCSATSIWSLIRYEDRLAQEARQGPMLVFIHGTGSNSSGSFGDLKNVCVEKLFPLIAHILDACHDHLQLRRADFDAVFLQP